MAFNIVELIADGEDSAFDQPCKFGHRCEGHAVYCHADHWEDSPRKCRRTWYTGGEVKDEDCPGYQPNPDFQGTPTPTVLNNPCTKCLGARFIKLDNDHISTCKHCMGDGEEPELISLTVAHQNILSTAQFADDERFMVLAEDDETREAVRFLEDLQCIEMHTMCPRQWGIAYLVHRTAKGKHLLHAFWNSPEYKRQTRNDERRRARYVKKHRYDPPGPQYRISGIRMIFPEPDVVIDESMLFDCANRAIDYFAGILTADQVANAFENRIDKNYEIYVALINGQFAGVASRRI